MMSLDTNPVQAYSRPQLLVLGDVRLLTETGSTVGIEDNNGAGNGCQGTTNTTFNMC